MPHSVIFYSPNWWFIPFCCMLPPSRCVTSSVLLLKWSNSCGGKSFVWKRAFFFSKSTRIYSYLRLQSKVRRYIHRSKRCSTLLISKVLFFTYKSLTFISSVVYLYVNIQHERKRALCISLITYLYIFYQIRSFLPDEIIPSLNNRISLVNPFVHLFALGKVKELFLKGVQ